MKFLFITLLILCIMSFQLSSCGKDISDGLEKNNTYVADQSLPNVNENNATTVISGYTPLMQPFNVSGVEEALKVLCEKEYYKKAILSQFSGKSFSLEEEQNFEKMINKIAECGGIPLPKCYTEHKNMLITFYPEAEYEDIGVRGICNCGIEYYATVYFLKDEYADINDISTYAIKRFGNQWLTNKTAKTISRKSKSISTIIGSPTNSKKSISWIEDGLYISIVTDSEQELEKLAQDFEYTIVPIK